MKTILNPGDTNLPGPWMSRRLKLQIPLANTKDVPRMFLHFCVQFHMKAVREQMLQHHRDIPF